MSKLIKDFNKFQNLINNSAQIEIGEYTGNGTYGSSNPNTITSNFLPRLLLVQSKTDNGMSASAGFFIYGAQGYSGSRQYASNYYGTVNWTNISQISWYGSSAKAQFNTSTTVYEYILFSTNKISPFEITFTTNTTYTVPASRNYLLELYGIRGGSYNSGYQGGSSCQRYDSISLTKGTSITIKIAKWTTPTEDGIAIQEPTTMFRSYTVENAGKYGNKLSQDTDYYKPVAGIKGTRNLGTDGTTTYNSINASSGKFGSTYGYGSKNGGSYFGGQGAVYLKYLG